MYRPLLSQKHIEGDTISSSCSSSVLSEGLLVWGYHMVLLYTVFDDDNYGYFKCCVIEDHAKEINRAEPEQFIVLLSQSHTKLRYLNFEFPTI